MTGLLRFFLDPGAGGCLWAGDPETRARLGYGPLDAAVYDPEGRISAPAPLPLSDTATALRDALLREALARIDDQAGPATCDAGRFRAQTDRLLALVRQDLAGAYAIRDETGQG